MSSSAISWSRCCTTSTTETASAVVVVDVDELVVLAGDMLSGFTARQMGGGDVATAAARIS